MGYFKSVAIDIQEAVAQEVSKGFETRDEMREVFLEIAYEYDVTVDDVYDIYYNRDVSIDY